MGWPNRILLQHLGAKLFDRRPVENPKRECAAARFNLLEHTAVGAGLIVARASVVADWSSAAEAFTVVHQEEAWNTKHEQSHPTLARTSAGVYTYTFAGEYTDNDGVVAPTALVAARVTAYGHSTVATWTLSGSVVEVHITVGGTAADSRFWLEVM